MKKYVELLLFATIKNMEENAGKENLNLDYFFCTVLQEAKESVMLSKIEYKELCNIASIFKTFNKEEQKETKGFNYLLQRVLSGFFKLKENKTSKYKALSFLGHEWGSAEKELNNEELDLYNLAMYNIVIKYLIIHY